MLLLLLLHWPLLGPRRGQGRQRTFVRALLRARNFTWYPKVSFGIRLEARVMICLTTPFYSGHLEGYFPWVSRSPFLSMWTTGPLETVSPRLVAMACLVCPVVSCFGCRGLEG